MVEAIFIDFYGTVVFEDGEIVKQISQIIYETGKATSASEIDGYWWNRFKELFENAYGENFRTQRDLEIQSLKDTIEHFESTADALSLGNTMFDYWVRPDIFEESKKFFEMSSVPVYIVSNIDRADVMEAIAFHDLMPAGVFTSEDAKSYKPRKELFELALKETGLHANQVIHIGDSLSSDIQGAASAGINAIWVNRSGRNVPDGVVAVGNLLEVLSKLKLVEARDKK